MSSQGGGVPEKFGLKVVYCRSMSQSHEVVRADDRHEFLFLHGQESIPPGQEPVHCLDGHSLKLTLMQGAGITVSGRGNSSFYTLIDTPLLNSTVYLSS